MSQHPSNSRHSDWRNGLSDRPKQRFAVRIVHLIIIFYGEPFAADINDEAFDFLRVGNPNTFQKHVWRCRIVLLTANGAGTSTIMRIAGVSKTAVWRWQERFTTSGVDGLLRDKTRLPQIAPLGAEAIDRVVARTLADPAGKTTNWIADMMAKASNISASAVRRIWKAHGLQPIVTGSSSCLATHG